MDTGHLITHIQGANLDKSASQPYRQFLGKKYEDFKIFYSSGDKRVWELKVKSKKYKTGHDSILEIQETEGPRTDRQSAHEGGKVVIPMHRLPLPARDIPGIHFYYRLSRPKGHPAIGNRE
jgi:hypothetical protein